MPDLPRISEAESHVMQVLWAKSPATAGEIIDALAGRFAWKPKTVKSLIARLVRKKAIGFVRDGKAYHYTPLVNEEAYHRAQRRSLLRRFYGGALKPMLAAFIEDENLSREDIAELRTLLDRKEGTDS